jgi:amino acid transporter
MSKNSTGKHTSGPGSLGTFAGVFTPSILTILGIILFLRLGYVVGSAGLKRALLIIVLANMISILTSISLSAIATNLKVKGGGDYYLISRTLGASFGGAIGIVLFLAQSISVAFYCIGFGEAITDIAGSSISFGPQIIAASAVLLLFVLAWLGADWATKFQYAVMGILCAALLSFFAGGLIKWDAAHFVNTWSHSPDSGQFWLLFAIFFPAVTGFTQGVSMSGDLRDPGKSLPLGTFVAVGISIVVYFGAAIIFAGSAPGDMLRADYGSMKRISWIGLFVDAGVIAATLSSAMASFLGAPRILQSLSKDRIFPFLNSFSVGSGALNNPRRGVVLSLIIALVTVALGNLNLIAPIVSMFFLVSYGLLNYATYFEARTASPSFRPRFRWFNKRVSLIGCLACLGTILAIDVAAGAVAVSVLFAVYQYVKRTAGPARWADSRRSYYVQQVRDNLLAAAGESEHDRDWRPRLLALTDTPQRRGQLLQFSIWLDSGGGFTSAVQIIVDPSPGALIGRKDAESALKKEISPYSPDIFPLVLVTTELSAGFSHLVQTYGIGPLRTNTVLLHWLDHGQDGFLGSGEKMYGRNLKAAFRAGCNILILNADDKLWLQLADEPASARRIDVWWWGGATSRLNLLLAYLITRNDAWTGCTIRVLAVAPKKDPEKFLASLTAMLADVRIDAEPELVHKPVSELIAERSKDASLVFLPFQLRGNLPLCPFGNQLDDILSKLPTTALSLAAEDIDLDAEPEEGDAAEKAAARDAVSDSVKSVRNAEEKAEKAKKDVDTREEKVRTAEQDGADSETVKNLRSELETARANAATLSRKAEKARADAEQASKKAEELGLESANTSDTQQNTP